MGVDDVEYVCRVCGYDYVDQPVWNCGEPSHDICVCCDVEFGYGDTMLEGVRTVRAHWENAGFTFDDPEFRPVDWDPYAQMRNIPPQWR
ncbi:hypothetical protein [Streptomyces sp. NPDC088400]|uniref:hypothetical protein n=1 Tax=Streptomyces sp. NPDC088400 TaxID=3365861 RepID=UPI0038182401